MEVGGLETMRRGAYDGVVRTMGQYGVRRGGGWQLLAG